MQTTAMLLRSSSTPTLECLHLAPPSHSEIASAGEPGTRTPLSLSLAACRAVTHPPSAASQPHLHLHPSSFKASSAEPPCPAARPRNPIRKVQSENDLCRRRSMGSLPAEFPSVFYNSDFGSNNFAIQEEADVTPSWSSAESEADATEVEEGDFDKIALPVGLGSYAKGKPLHVISQDSLMQGMEGKQREVSNALPQVDMVASSSGRWETVETFERSSSIVSASRKASTTMGLTHAKEARLDLDVACSGDGGGSSRGGMRPRIITGEGGGGSDAGGGMGGDWCVAEQHYQHALQNDPGNSLLLRNYAQYLVEVKHDYGRAEEYFERAILASPTDGELLGQYAKMLSEVKHDMERAAIYYERAVQAAPENSYVMAAYASFLWSSEEEGQESNGSGFIEPPTWYPSLVSTGVV